MSTASQLSFGNAAVLTTGTIPGERGVAAGSTFTSFVDYNGTTSVAGLFDGGTTTPSATNRLNYNGNLFVTNLTGNYANGNSNVNIPSANGNVTISAIGNANVVVITGTGVNVAGTLNVTGTYVPRVVTLADGTSVTFNATTTDMAVQTNTQAVGTLSINAVTGTPVDGQKIMFRLQSTNIQTFSWNAVFAGSTDLALPTASSGSNKYDYIGFIYNATAVKWQIAAKNFGF
jgi:hypothetical protein